MLDLDANQRLAVRVPSPEVRNVTISHSVIGSVTLPADSDPGPGRLYQGLALPPGKATIAVEALSAQTTADDTVEAMLNAQYDMVDDGRIVTQSFVPSTIDVHPGAPITNRAAVRGRIEAEIPRIISETEGVFNYLKGSWDEAGSSTTWSVNGNGNPKTSLNNRVAGSVNASGSPSSKNYDPVDVYEFFARAGDKVTLRSWGSKSGGGTISAT